jgi:hypothetical protein
LPVANRIKIIRELLPGNRCAIGPIFLAGDDLAEGIVLAKRLVRRGMTVAFSPLATLPEWMGRVIYSSRR